MPNMNAMLLYELLVINFNKSMLVDLLDVKAFEPCHIGMNENNSHHLRDPYGQKVAFKKIFQTQMNN